MIDLERNSRFLAAVAIGIAVVAATYIGASRWEHVRNKPKERSLKVTGSAKKRIVSDLAEWSATITVVDPDRTAAYRSVHDQMGKTRAFLIGKGFKDDQVRSSSVVVNELNETETVGTGEQRIERRVFKGYRVQQAVTIRSTDVPRVERTSREMRSTFGTSVDRTVTAWVTR